MNEAVGNQSFASHLEEAGKGAQESQKSVGRARVESRLRKLRVKNSTFSVMVFKLQK